MKDQILKYLGYKNQVLTDDINKLIDSSLEEVKELSNFKYVYIKLDMLPDFLNNDVYKNHLKGCNSIYLVSATLGLELDKKIKYYEIKDKTKALVMDACGSAYLEYLADEYEKCFDENRTFRFCPGYENTSLDDNKQILELLKDLKPGITFLDSKMLLPFKSIVGIIGLGSKNNRSCKNCVIVNCKFKEEGITCYKK